MSSYVPKEVRNLSKQIIKSFSHIPSATMREKFSQLGEFKRKKQAIKLIEIAKKQNNLSFLESRYNNSSKCEVIWGEWSLGLKLNNPDYIKYDKISFDLTVDIPGKQIYKFFYLFLSKHALERLLERAETECKNSFEMRNFLDSVLKTLILRCLTIWENNLNEQKAEGYVVVKDLIMPISMEKGINFKKEESRVFTIKTVMPTSYKKTLPSQQESKDNIFDYENLLIPKNANILDQMI